LQSGMVVGRSAVNTVTPWVEPHVAEARVLHVQTKLHKWASADPGKTFGDLFNLVCDQAALQVAWRRVRANRGSRTTGVDGMTRADVENRVGVDRFVPKPLTEAQLTPRT
jgi:RNA-directed DNA polymerase